jgi:NhaP-type Na+/H+ or K+/H+ antiporter
MHFTAWYLIVGAVLIAMALAGSLVKRLPLTPSLLYLALGIALGPYGATFIRIDPVGDARLIERISEVAVIISLFTAGLKLRSPLSDPRWLLPLRLASASMLVTVGLITLAGVTLLDLPLGAAILLGAILAPTDPVLASDVQVSKHTDNDRLRFALTGEAGLNDGTAFPFVMLGLGVMGLRDLGSSGWRWIVVDVVWAVGAGLVIGWLAGWLIGKLVLFLRRVHKEAVGLDDFLSLGLLALSYGAAVAVHAYGFLAVFAAGLALAHIEQGSARDAAAAPPLPPPSIEVAEAADVAKEDEIATNPDTAHAYMARAVLGFNEQLERIAEVAMVILLGGMLIVPGWLHVLWFVPLLLLVIRPIAVYVGTAGAHVTPLQRGMIAWFGIRGIGSIYYLTYAIAHGIDETTAGRLTAITFVVVAASIAVHGISVTPLMNRYGKAMAARRARREQQPPPVTEKPASMTS